MIALPALQLKRSIGFEVSLEQPHYGQFLCVMCSVSLEMQLQLAGNRHHGHSTIRTGVRLWNTYSIEAYYVQLELVSWHTCRHILRKF